METDLLFEYLILISSVTLLITYLVIQKIPLRYKPSELVSIILSVLVGIVTYLCLKQNPIIIENAVSRITIAIFAIILGFAIKFRLAGDSTTDAPKPRPKPGDTDKKK